jgi:hypothetical protein
MEKIKRENYMDRLKLLETTSDYMFPEFHPVYNRPSIADLVPPSKRCGIYILEFKDNSYYVGQAVDITRRYVQHRKNHDDIEGISFRKFKKQELNKVEEYLIKIIEEKGIMLRNISLTSLPKGETDLDLLIPKEQQEHWLASNNPFNGAKQILHLPEQEIRYARKYNSLLKETSYRKVVLPFLREYFQHFVLNPPLTEMSFWSITCLSQEETKRRFQVLSRLNFYWCEVLTVFKSNGQVNFSFHLAKSGLSEGYLSTLNIESIEISDHYYKVSTPRVPSRFVSEKV